jgi:hypothetical protein
MRKGFAAATLVACAVGLAAPRSAVAAAPTDSTALQNAVAVGNGKSGIRKHLSRSSSSRTRTAARAPTPAPSPAWVADQDYEYHLACDAYGINGHPDNINDTVLSEMSDAVAHAVLTFAQTTSAANGTDNGSSSPTKSYESKGNHRVR